MTADKEIAPRVGEAADMLAGVAADLATLRARLPGADGVTRLLLAAACDKLAGELAEAARIISGASASVTAARAFLIATAEAIGPDTPQDELLRHAQAERRHLAALAAGDRWAEQCGTLQAR